MSRLSEPVSLSWAVSSMVLMASCFASSMKAQVFMTMASASVSSFVSS